MKREDFKKQEKAAMLIKLRSDAKRRIPDKDNIDNWIVMGTVTKIGRKYLNVTPLGSRWPITFDMIQEFSNDDYVVFPSYEDAYREKKRQILYEEVSKYFTKFAPKAPYTLEQLEKIKEILEN